MLRGDIGHDIYVRVEAREDGGGGDMLLLDGGSTAPDQKFGLKAGVRAKAELSNSTLPSITS